MVTSLIIVYMLYISHQVCLFVFLGVFQITDNRKRLVIVIMTQLTFWVSEVILLLILTVLYQQQKLISIESHISHQNQNEEEQNQVLLDS